MVKFFLSAQPQFRCVSCGKQWREVTSFGFHLRSVTFNQLYGPFFSVDRTPGSFLAHVTNQNELHFGVLLSPYSSKGYQAMSDQNVEIIQ